MPFGSQPHPKNYLTKLRSYERLVDVRNSLSFIDTVAKVAVFFAQNSPLPGIYNVCERGSVTSREVVDLMGLSKEWVSEQEFAGMVKAPRSHCVLNTDKLSRLMDIPDVHESIGAALAAGA